MAYAILDRPSTFTIVAQCYGVKDAGSSTSLGSCCPRQSHSRFKGFHHLRGLYVGDEDAVITAFWLA